jgi:hypothetical protein
MPDETPQRTAADDLASVFKEKVYRFRYGSLDSIELINGIHEGDALIFPHDAILGVSYVASARNLTNETQLYLINCFDTDVASARNLTNQKPSAFSYELKSHELRHVHLQCCIKIDFRDLTIDEAENLAYFELEQSRSKESQLAQDCASFRARRNSVPLGGPDDDIQVISLAHPED